MADQEKNCYLGINGKKYGPLSEADIHKLYAAKKINGDTKFARKGATEWIALSQSGIVTSSVAQNDDLPPLPKENKTVAQSSSPTNKSLKRIIIGLSATIGVFVLVFIVIFTTRTDPATQPTDITVAQGQNTNPSAPSETQQNISTESQAALDNASATEDTTTLIPIGWVRTDGYWSEFYLPPNWRVDWGDGQFPTIHNDEGQLLIFGNLQDMFGVATDEITFMDGFVPDHDFQFNDGNIGTLYRVYERDAIYWINRDVFLNSPMPTFADNEEIITTIARTLTSRNASSAQSGEGTIIVNPPIAHFIDGQFVQGTGFYLEIPADWHWEEDWRGTGDIILSCPDGIIQMYVYTTEWHRNEFGTREWETLSVSNAVHAYLGRFTGGGGGTIYVQREEGLEAVVIEFYYGENVQWFAQHEVTLREIAQTLNSIIQRERIGTPRPITYQDWQGEIFHALENFVDYSINEVDANFFNLFNLELSRPTSQNNFIYFAISATNEQYSTIQSPRGSDLNVNSSEIRYMYTVIEQIIAFFRHNWGSGLNIDVHGSFTGGTQLSVTLEHEHLFNMVNFSWTWYQERQPQQQTPTQQARITVTAVSGARVTSQPDAAGFFTFERVCSGCNNPRWGGVATGSMAATRGTFGATSRQCTNCRTWNNPSFRGE